MGRAWLFLPVALLSLVAGPALALPCGDLDLNDAVDSADALILRLHLAGAVQLQAAQTERCDVVADGMNGPPATPTCSLLDAVVLARTGATLAPGVAEICAAASAPDPASTVEITSACLTLGSGAQAAVVLTLQDLGGNPLTGATVTMMADAGTLTSVSSAGSTYWAVLTPPLSGASATISIEANGVPMGTSPVIAFAAPFTDPFGGAGGCPADGNLRVTVVDETGASLPGAFVMVGNAEQASAFATTFGSPPSGANTAVTDGAGVAEFRDFGANLDGPQRVTAAAAGREYFTLIDVDAADLVVPLAAIPPVVPTAPYSGAVSGFTAPFNDPIEFAAVIADTTIDKLARFDVASLFGENECYDPGGLSQPMAIPSNLYLPQQCAVFVLVCLQQLPQHSWSLDLAGGERLLFPMSGAMPLSLLVGGPLENVLPDAFDYLTRVGVSAVSVVPPTGGVITPNVSQLFSAPNVSCTVSNAPVGADVYCVTGGDYDSGAFPQMTPGEGRLFVTGLDAGIAVASPASLALTATSVANTGVFSGIEYLGGAIAFWDEMNPNAPAQTADGSSVVFDRSNASFSGAGGAMTFDDFFPIRVLTRAARNLDLEALPGTPHPAAHYTRTEIERVITETTALPCTIEPQIREQRHRYWTLIAPGDVNGFALPTPPAGWPREALGGDLAGLVDVTATPEDDALVWTNTTVYEGLNPSFDYDQIRLFTFRSFVTHASTNEVPY